MTQVIELNDAGVRLGANGLILIESPGYAVVSAQRLLIGEAARRESRLDPRHATSAFWHRLSTDPVPNPHPSARTQADLAHAHLLQVFHAGDPADLEIIFSISGSFEREQLALLLGIARACPFTAVGLVDSAVAATADTDPDADRVVCVEGHLHQAAATVVSGNGAWRREQVLDLPNMGLAGLRDAWINLIADIFIRETRFDPLHDAGTEQRLFDRLDEWIDALAAQPEIEIELETSGQVYRIALPRARMIEKVAPRYALLGQLLASAAAASDDTRILLAPSLARLPGLLDTLRSNAGFDVDVLRADAAIRGALAHETGIRQDGDALRFVTSLPRAPAAPAPGTGNPADGPDAQVAADTAARSIAQAAATADTVTGASPGAPSSHPASLATEQAPQQAAASAPTHVLIDHQAWPLATPHIELGGPDGLCCERFPVRLGVLQQQDTGWSLQVDSGPSANGPSPLMLGESRVLGPERALVTLIRVETGGSGS